MSLQKVNTGNDIEEALVRINRKGYALREAELSDNFLDTQGV